MIPKVLHYCWFGGKPLPGDAQKCIASWEKYCPDYQIIRWDEQNFDVHCHPFMEKAYANQAWAFVSDYARLRILHDHGGIYLDTDVELKKNLDFLLENTCYVGCQQVGQCINTGLGFGSHPGGEAVSAMLAEYDRVEFDPARKAELSCPNLNTRALRPLGAAYTQEVLHLPALTVYPARYFDPVSPGDARNLLCGDTVSIHQYNATWTSSGQRLKRRLIRLLGQERVMKIRGVFKK